jgi:hypothetical protein
MKLRAKVVKKLKLTPFDADQPNCPHCKANWIGDPIPEKYRHCYAPTSTHYHRVIGVELAWDDPKHYDGVSYWRCPDCGSEWNRWTGEKVK